MKCVINHNKTGCEKIPQMHLSVANFSGDVNSNLFPHQRIESREKFALDFWQIGGYTLSNLKMVPKRSTLWKGVSYSWLQCTGYKRLNFRYKGYVVSFISLTGQVPFFQDLFFPHPIDSGVRNFF
jgi:hypothetical protein